MKIYPAIDIRGGRCVRLRQGDPEQQTVFSDDPSEMARRWVGMGAEWLHVVDLDGAFGGAPENREAIAGIVGAVSVPVQLGGGLRGMEQILAAAEAGIARVILGTAAFESPDLVATANDALPGRVAVGIDARDGCVATEGWTRVTDTEASSFARQVAGLGACVIVYTDIGRDGMHTGPNVAATMDLAESVDAPVIASGGVSDLADVQAVAVEAGSGIEGLIIGSALYRGTVDLEDAIAVGRSVA
ncbi:1-(5-phosphoribosyl)-5-[(5-phosphoribosylamino)methylideneamino]imidazole-4-carboxamide isomerase [Candidatus Poribacteria bacterium]|jgi:phosphoribosylformimino-5-aminoimidazole carboxamide ribotide isomerase|nr:1-(5-phosphoribosyl)-5-[(5-phosphoribosylamino)methylideneamino]imidazole-4-carboxamide isomerase [Candidatus Poribacteria bacterium]MBT7100002.1 1-(5-phosphoribosyl)-5-[(5-phosphoribosylamino)methylideneamino]imidazole-4-carboxamide isomerase [Candidatus Poribacteria bacterium]MBT7804066.1 1-(5-phosphoribosyl)-5-[(5-phosphoribosylamino)methylideneamino]imidazole-4-carboxamide isomerase [Candidatus Poribacteria bacterium]